MKLINFFKGKKTYIITSAVLVLGALEGLGIYEISEVGWMVLLSLGLGFLRAGVEKTAAAVKKANK